MVSSIYAITDYIGHIKAQQHKHSIKQTGENYMFMFYSIHIVIEDKYMYKFANKYFQIYPEVHFCDFCDFCSFLADALYVNVKV